MRDIKDYIEKYSDEPFEAEMVKIRKKTVVTQCNKYAHDNILEIGCGMDPFFLDYKDFNRMVIAEPGDAFAENARKLSYGNSSNIHVVTGFLEDNVDRIKKMDIDFDFIILSSVLHELDEPNRMLGAIRALCSSTTVVHINVPNANSLHRLIAIESGMIKDVHERSEQMQLMQRRRTYDKELLCEEVASAGFDVIDEGTYFIKPFTHAQMQKCIDNNIINEKVLLGLEKVIKYMPELGAGIYVDVRIDQN